MTKLRPPLSFEDALDRVAGVIGWVRVAEIAEQSERTVRNWSDPDTGPKAGRAVSLELALVLDQAYQDAGGDGSPMFHCFATRREEVAIASCPDCAAIARAAAALAKEAGEAASAAVIASLPTAGLDDLAIAEREIAQSSASTHSALSAIRARRAAILGVQPPSGPEVPPSTSTVATASG